MVTTIEHEFFLLFPFDTERERHMDQREDGVNLHTIRNTERMTYGYDHWCRDNASQQ